ncbi:MAG: hypothetical protein HY909_08595 [Deltaproteobacteria bacterium]|nr:hypothetical protein [Deltaproteobacteria bacterium]
MRTRFDAIAKELWREGLGDLGRVTVEVEVTAPPQRADAVFEPVEAHRAALAGRGLVGRMVADPSMLEAFHEAPDGEEVRDCHRKFLSWRHALSEGRERARLWLVVAGDPVLVRRAFALRRLRGWPEGVLGAPEGFGLCVVVVASLPETRDTLALRLFGRGRVLRRAALELLALPRDAWERRLVPVLLRWRTQIPEIPAPRTQDEEDYMLSTQEWYEAWKKDARDEGIAQGIGPLVRQFERRLDRTLTEDERAVLRLRLEALGAARLGDVVLDLAPQELAAWLQDPAAR